MWHADRNLASTGDGSISDWAELFLNVRHGYILATRDRKGGINSCAFSSCLPIMTMVGTRAFAHASRCIKCQAAVDVLGFIKLSEVESIGSTDIRHSTPFVE